MPVRWSALLDRVGVTSSLVFALAAGVSIAAASLALGLLITAYLLSPLARRALASDPTARIALLFIVYVVVRAAWAGVEIPETRTQQFADTVRWLYPLSFLALAWWVATAREKASLALALALAGLLGGMLINVDWGSLGDIQVQARTGFKLKIIFFGLAAGTAALGLLVFAPRILKGGRGWPGWLGVPLWLTALGLTLYGLMATRSRGAWLAAAVVIPPALLVRYRGPGRTELGGRRTVLAGAAALVILAAVLVPPAVSTVTQRLLQEKAAGEAVLAGELDEIPESSIAFRLHVQRFGLETWLARPLFGWGPGSTEYLIAHSGDPSLLHPVEGGGREWMDHFHNTYLEALVRLGLVGTLLILALLWRVFRAVHGAYRSGGMPRDHAVFAAGWAGLLAIWSLFDFRLLHYDVRYYWIILAGVAYSFTVGRSGPTRAPAQTAEP